MQLSLRLARGQGHHSITLSPSQTSLVKLQFSSKQRPMGRRGRAPKPGPDGNFTPEQLAKLQARKARRRAADRAKQRWRSSRGPWVWVDLPGDVLHHTVQALPPEHRAKCRL